MPNPWDPPWQPNWGNVRFDAGLAQIAVSALLETAAEVEAVTKERTDLADVARQHWAGRYRREFDERFGATTRVAGQLAVDLRQAAANLQQAANQAQQDQLGRLQQRDQWNQQQAANYREWQLQQQQLQQQQAAAHVA
jgi:hypothetical protein